MFTQSDDQELCDFHVLSNNAFAQLIMKADLISSGVLGVQQWGV